MDTQVEKINESAIKKAATLLKKGEVVAFPTETVYGLGADAFNTKAVANIFKAKNRPADNPLIVHINHLDQLSELVKNIPPTAQKLIAKFWPGPLSIVFKKQSFVPAITTGDLDTIVVRFPQHPAAQALIKAANTPIAAPSANSSGKLSPTEAKHVLADLDGKIPLILDAGPIEFGLESTVVDCTITPPIILRPGSITLEMLQKIIPAIQMVTENSPVRSPGMKYRHYAPNAPIILFTGNSEETTLNIEQHLAEHSNEKTALLWHSNLDSKGTGNSLKLSADPAVAGPKIFAVLRTLDAAQPDKILIQGYQDKAIGTAIMNRLRKAATEIIGD